MRLDTDPAIIARLSALGLTPGLLGSGSVAGRTFVIQQRITGEPLNSRGLAAHWKDAAALLRRLHEDIVLARMVRRLSPAELVETSSSRLPVAHPARAGARELLARSDRLGAVLHVATHGDPNAGNFLFDGKLWLIDWDELQLADPVRDVGQVAWWYLDRAAWPAFLTAAGIPFEDAAMDRLFWWVAAESLDVAVRLLPSDPESAAAFLGDMAAALAHQPNPRRRPAG
ncbi:MAG: phosphotransferase [Chloroflexi bacterium]|nr:phosphotransferase [Chloroflexota bacterium]